MIEVVTPETAFLYRDKLNAMFRLRDEIFNQRMGWEVNSRDGKERDVYDLLRPIYLLATGEAGQVCGSWRLLPTTGPNMLRDVFTELMGGEPVPEHPEIWEASRFVVAGTVDGESGLYALNRLTGELFCGLVEFALLFGIREIITVYDIRIGRLLKRIGCAPFWQGPVLAIGNTRTTVGRFEISDRVLAGIKEATGVTGTILIDHESEESNAPAL